MSLGKDEGRRDSRAWLGPPGEGGERLARAFGIGSSAGRDVGRKLEDLQASLTRIAEELSDLSLGAPPGAAGPPSPEPEAAVPVVELPRVPRATDRDYWLSRCEHFTVYAGDRLVGVVEGMRFESRVDRPDVIEVRSGRLGRQLLLVRVDDVGVVEPEAKTLVLQTYPPATGVREFLRVRAARLRTPLRALLH